MSHHLLVPDDESKRLERFFGQSLSRLRFCGMRNCNEEFDEADSGGLHELTWAIILDTVASESLCVSWTQDSFGNPNRLCVCESEGILSLDSVIVQDVSNLKPWCHLIGQPCLRVVSHSYSSNYACDTSEETRHDVLWGLEFRFPSQSFLVAAAWHGHAVEDPLANDELVVAYTANAIGQLIAIRADYQEDWRP